MENSNEKSDSSGMKNNIDNTYNENNSSENNDIDSGIFYGSKIEIIDKSLESQKNEKILSISNNGPNNETEKFKNLEKKNR